MALSGLEIYKKLPQTNCGECGVPTCLAFAMKLAGGQAELDKCPYITEESKAELSESSAPPIRKVVIGTGEKALKVGEETVMYRHEKRFENPCGLAVLIADDDSEADKKIEAIKNISFERIGLTLSADLVAIKSNSDAAKFEALVEMIVKNTDKGIILISEDPQIVAAGLKVSKERRPLIYAATKDNFEKMSEIAKTNDVPLAVKGANLDEAAEVAEKLVNAGHKELIIDTGARDMETMLKDQVAVRALALKSKFKPLGFPTIVLANEMADNVAEQTVIGSIPVAKYGGIVVLSEAVPESLYPLLVERMNIFTDPQRPMMVEEGIYEINNPTENSPVLLTTNFSLTYFILSSEVEASRVPTYLAVHDSEGLSVLTAWAAGKFVPENIGPFIKKSGIFDKVNHKKLVIPGYVAQISGELEEEVPGVKVQVGPREAGDVPKFLKTWSPANEIEQAKVSS